MRRRSLPWVVVAWILLASFSTTQAAQSMTDETILNSGATFASRMRPSYLSASALIRQFYLEHCTGRGESGDIYEHLPMLRQLATQVDHITEMGSGVVATWAFLDGLVARQYAGYEALQIVGVDGHNHDNIDAVAEEAGIGYQIRPEDHTNFDIEPTDLLFIDPLQVDNHVKYQLAQHADRTRRFIVVHDTTVDSVVTATIQQGWGAENHSKESGSPGEIRHGLWPVVEEFLTEHSDTWMLRKRFTHNNGLTILERIQGQDCQCPARQFDTTSTKRREGKEGWDLKQPVLPVFYLSRDRSEWLRQSIESLRRIVLSPLEIIVFDNGSRYLPALEFLKELEAQGTKVHRSAQNLGRESMYAAVNQIKETWFEENKQRALSFYVVADPAITFPEGTRPDILEVFQHVLESHPEVTAVGPWQIKDDIPKFYEGSWFTALEQIEFNVRQNADVRDMRGQSVDARLCPLADFVMFRKAHLYAGGPVVGLAFERTFAARHLDYYIDPNNRTEEQQYHYEHANPTAHHGSKHYLEAMKAKRWFGDFPSVDDRNRVWTQALEFANLRKLDSALQLFDALRKGFPLQAKRYNDAAVTEMKLGRWFDALVSLSQGLHVAQQSTGAPHLTLLCENMHTFLANTFHRKDSDAQWHRKVVMEKLKDCPLKDSQPLQMPAVVETAPASPTNDTFLPAEHTSHLAVLRGGVQRVWIVHRGAWSHKQIARALATAAWKAGFKDVQIAYGSSPFDAVHAFAREAAVRQAHSAPEERMTVVVLGILDPEVFPTRSFRASMGYSLAVYQTEQPGGMGPVIDTFPFVDEVWDFAPSHVASWNRNSSVPNASRIMFLSFSPRQFAPDIDLSTQLHALDAAATTDVLFVGSGVWRRAAVRNALEAALPGKRVDFRIMQGQQIYDEDLDKAVDEARVVLNVHYHVDAALEDHRIAHMASRGACIVSETSHDPGLDHEWRGAIEFAQEAGEHGEDHGALVGTVQRLLFGPAARRVELRKAALERERKRFAWMVSRMEAARKDSVRK